ncbi:MAG: YHYH protein [Acidimicrobiia bacterium]|nr:YHYH protein [Acidimicrobiia bacterium]
MTSPRLSLVSLALLATVIAAACGDSGETSTVATQAPTAATVTGSTAPAATSQGTDATTASGAVDITNAVFTERDADCAAYDSALVSDVSDISRAMMFAGNVVITAEDAACTLTSNNIPNHDFNDDSARFANAVAEVQQTFSIPRDPQLAASSTALSQRLYNAVMLNGVPVDLLSAGCYRPSDQMADADGNVAIGCSENDSWLLDPLGTESKFGADEHNAHTQPDGSYHYHGNPNALFDDSPGPEGSPVIGFAADGFPIYGSYFVDADNGELRKAVSGYTLRAGDRPSSDTDPGGAYDGLYVDDWEFTGSGDLDECNGMTIDGQYGYYVTDSYPWIIACHSGTPDTSFAKGR